MKPNYRTEREQKLYNDATIFRLSKLLKSNPELFSQIVDYLPYTVYLNEVNTLKITFGNADLLNKLELCLTDIYTHGFHKVKLISEENTREHSIKKINEFKKRNDSYEICSYFQHMKFYKKLEWNLTYKIKHTPNLYFNFMHSSSDFGSIGIDLERTLNETLIDKNGWERFQSLTKSQKALLKDLSNGKSMNEISQKNEVSIETVKTHRKNMMKKIDAHNILDIVNFANTFQLIDEL